MQDTTTTHQPARSGHIRVLPGEKIIEIRRYVGQDGIERELIIVDRLGSQPPKAGYPNTTRTFRLYGKRPLAGIVSGLKKGHGYGLGVVTDRTCKRYEY